MATATRHMVVDGGAQADVLGTALAGLVASKLSEAETEASVATPLRLSPFLSLSPRLVLSMA